MDADRIRQKGRPAGSKRIVVRESTLLLFAAGTLSSLIWWRFSPTGLIAGGGEMVAIAETLVDKHTFGNPFPGHPTGPTAMLAPLYPFILSLLIWIFGGAAATAAVCLSAVTAGAHAALLPSVSETMLGDRMPGGWAALLFVALPSYTMMPSWECWAAAVALMGACIAAHDLLSRHEHRGRNAFMTGIIVGVLALLNPATAVAGFLWSLYTLRAAQPNKRILSCICLIAAGAGIATGPWLIRNYNALGVISLKDNFGMTFYSAHNPCARPSVLENVVTGCYEAHFPGTNEEEYRLLTALGEAAYQRNRQEVAQAWMQRNPRRSFRLLLAHLLEFWFPTRYYGPSAYSVWLITTLSIAGVLAMRGLSTQWVLFSWVALACYSLPYYLVASDIRYRYPVLWVSLLPAGAALAVASRRATSWIACVRSNSTSDTCDDARRSEAR